ncbi:hypothetical protein B0H14DRAFT_3141597 [Mycena olivaceomarginata]|nr:hypothetical protein B0H14DRAFT_3141597 [Mycena olivaceomarginata]
MTLVSFINELIEVGESIRRSIEKVNENRQQIRDLTDEVVQILYDLAKLTRGHEDTFRGPEFLSVLENLKTELLYVHSKTRKLSPVQLPGLRGVRSRFKAWQKRDDLEGNIGCLKEHVSKCYSRFTAFSAARNEQNTLRLEQTVIVNHVESQVKAQRLEGMMAQVLLETPFGQNVANRTMEIILADPTHSSLESQYMSAQMMSLIALLEGLLISGKLVLDGPLSDPAQLFHFISKQCTPLHLLHEILGVVINIKESHYIQIPLGSMENIMLNLGTSLSTIGMDSESIAWGRFKIQMLHRLDCSAAMTLPDKADTLMDLSIAYCRQHQFQSAIQVGQQSLDLWHCLSDILPKVDIRICLIMVLTTQTQSLLETGQKIAALSIAQDAVALSCSMLEQMVESSSEFSSSVDEFNAGWSCGAIFELAKTLSLLHRHLESYEALKEGFQTIVRLPLVFPRPPPSGEHIDSFLDQICKVVEGGRFSLVMLVDCVILFRNLARIYPKQFSTQFLWLLHSYAYFAQQDAPSMENIRLFLEPNKDRPSPRLDVTRPMGISFGGDGIQIEDTVRTFFTFPSQPSHHLIRNILITHFDEAIVILRDVVKKLTSDPTTNEWILWTVTHVVRFLTTLNQLALLQVSARTIEHLGAILANRGSRWKWVLDCLLDPIFIHFWRAGLLEDALKICEQVIKFLDSRRHSDDTVVATEWQLNRHFILCDMGRFSDAIGMIQQTTIDSVPQVFFLHPYIIQLRILRRAGRNQEALQLLRKGATAGCQKYWTDNVEVFHFHLYFLLAESAAVWEYVGNGERALRHAGRAVAACRKDMGPNEDLTQQKCILIHSLVILSDCLVTLGRNDKALAAAQEAVSVYTENAPHMWGSFLYTLRKKELGGNAFHALSLRLVTSGTAEQALLNAEKATELYREVITLVPRHLPTLASSLRNLGSILWDVGRRDEAIAACEEAAGIMRKLVNPETYFLPALAEALEQLADYLVKKGDIRGASATAAECSEVRREYAALPPEPEFLFEKVVDMVESDDEEEGWAEADEYHDSSEGPSIEEVESDDEVVEYHDASEAPTSIEPSTLILEPSGRSSTPTPGPSIGIDIPIRSKQCGISITAENSAVVVLNSSSAVESLTTTDTVKGILTMPLEVDMRLNMRMHLRSTLMDVVWWVLLGTLFTIAAIAWRRVA